MSANQSVGRGCAAMAAAWVLGWPSGAVRAVVAMKGWEWFVADTFGVRPLSLVEAWGLFLVISFATMHPGTPDDRDPYEIMLGGFITSLLISGSVFVGLLILAGFR